MTAVMMAVDFTANNDLILLFFTAVCFAALAAVGVEPLNERVALRSGEIGFRMQAKSGITRQWHLLKKLTRIIVKTGLHHFFCYLNTLILLLAIKQHLP